MKKCCLVALILLFALQAAAFATLKNDPVYRDARLNGAQTRIELHIQDDDETPVPDAKIKAYLGMNFRPRGTWIDGTTDTNGVFVIEGKTCGDEIEVFVTKDGYYDSHVVYCYAKMGEEHDVKDGKWQPYGAVTPIRLRKVRNPIPMIASVERIFNNTKCINEWIGYDLAALDFVSPQGKGKISDFEVSFDWDGKWLPDYKGMGVRIRFTEKFSGYCLKNAAVESKFLGPYSADVNASYIKEAAYYERMTEDGRREEEMFDQGKCWVVRTRCKTDDDGKLISANYAVIYNIEFSCDRDGVAGVYVKASFNPTPNDTNLEPKSGRAR